MRRWSATAERVAATTRTSEKIRLLAAELRTLDPDELPIAAIFFAGRPFAEADQRSTGLGWATIAAGAARVAGVEAGAIGRAYDRSSDLGQAVADVLVGRVPQPSDSVSPSLTEVAATFTAIEAAPGPSRKADLFADLLARCDPVTGKYVVKILTGELRIGLREGLLEAAIAQAFDRPLQKVQWAGMLTGDIGETARLAREERLEEARLRLFHPLKFMLAAPVENAAEILARLGSPVWVEDKYDGIRAQLHKLGGTVRLYSRDLHDVTGQFPEVSRAAAQLPWDGILDGEVLGFSGGQVLPFLALQARLGRRDPSAAIQAQVPVIFVAFDALALGSGGDDVEPLLALPLTERRRRLEMLDLAGGGDGRGSGGDGRGGGVGADGASPFVLSRLATADSVESLEAAFEAARERRNEGLMVKDPTSTYSPGRRGYGWLKMKKALATIDCVVVGVEVGHGKRHGVLSDFTFAVRDPQTDRLVTIGKAYSGLTDAEIAEMTAWFEAHTIRRVGRYRQVEPSIVIEVAFDVIMRSTRHESGFALRFPRIIHLRRDKPPTEIDTLETVEALYRGLQRGAEYLVTAGARQGAAASTPRG